MVVVRFEGPAREAVIRACAMGRGFLVVRDHNPSLATTFCRGFLVTLQQAFSA